MIGSRSLRTFGLFAGALTLLAGVGVAWGAHAMQRDCRRQGAYVGWASCIAGPEPEFDWTRPGLRRHLWGAIDGPAWLFASDEEEVREGAAWFLMHSAQAKDESRVLKAAYASNIAIRLAAFHLALCWMDDARFPDRAKAMLLGRSEERTLAVLALGIVAGEPPRELVHRSGDTRTFSEVGADSYLRLMAGTSPEEQSAEWLAWLDDESNTDTATMQCTWIANLISPENDTDDRAYPQDHDSLGTWMTTGVGRGWAMSMGISIPKLPSELWTQEAAFRRALAEDIRDAEPVALTPRAFLGLFFFASSGF